MSLCRVLLIVAVGATLQAGVPNEASAQATTQGFVHEAHAGLVCSDCHANGQATAGVNTAWCASCHHEGTSVAECSRCHEDRDIVPATRPMFVDFSLPGREPRARELPFDHPRHLGLACEACHTTGSPSRAEATCAGCHREHHEPERECAACHDEPPAAAHPIEVHLNLASCGGAGCHSSEGRDDRTLAGSRQACLSCHRAQSGHEPGLPCADCHLPGIVGREGALDRW